MKIIRNKFIPFKGYIAITIGNIIFVRKEYEVTDILINHESIHYEQEKELGYVGFYLLYILEYLYNRIKYKNGRTAYHNISFEKEAYDNQRDLDYIPNRKKFSWLKYL